MQQNLFERIDLFLSLLSQLYADHYAKHYSNLVPPRFDLNKGDKYIRVVTIDRRRDRETGEIIDGPGGSVYCFISRENGDLLKAAGWKGPAKGARGNIFNDNCDVGTRATVHGGGLYR